MRVTVVPLSKQQWVWSDFFLSTVRYMYMCVYKFCKGIINMQSSSHKMHHLPHFYKYTVVLLYLWVVTTTRRV